MTDRHEGLCECGGCKPDEVITRHVINTASGICLLCGEEHLTDDDLSRDCPNPVGIKFGELLSVIQATRGGGH